MATKNEKALEADFDLKLVKALADNERGEFADAERGTIAELCEKYGVKIRKTNCTSCYFDAVAELYKVLTDLLGAAANTGCVAKLKKQRPFVIMRNLCPYHISQATLTDAKAREWLAIGVLRPEHFDVLPPAEDAPTAEPSVMPTDEPSTMA